VKFAYFLNPSQQAENPSSKNILFYNEVSEKLLLQGWSCHWQIPPQAGEPCLRECKGLIFRRSGTLLDQFVENINGES
jgi:hypothetical protein